jgi:uncharacterized membrane protein
MSMFKLKNFLRPDLFFFVTSIFFGVCTVFVTGPFQVPDEFQHFNRAYAVSQGNFFGDRGTVPASVGPLAKYSGKAVFNAGVQFKLGEITAFLRIPLSRNETVKTYFPNVAVYSFLPYLPQSLGLFAGSTIVLSPLALLYAGRLTNVLFYIFICTLAIRTTPVFKWVFVLLMLMPMSLFQAASVSADSSLNAYAFLAIAIFLRCIFDPDVTMGSMEFLLILGVTFLLAFCKSNYVLIAGLFFAIPISKFGSKRNYFTQAGILVVSVLLFSTLSVGMGKSIYMDFRPAAGIRPADQITFLSQHPARFFTMSYKSLRILGKVYFISYIGLLGWIDTLLPNFLYYFYPAALIAAVLFDDHQGQKIPVWQRLVFPGVFVGSVLAIFLALYVTWTPYKQSWIDGMQGRYLIPVVPVLLPVLYHNIGAGGLKKAAPYWHLILAIFILIALITMTAVLLRRFYVI